MKIYAKQVAPEVQESPLWMFGEWPNGIVADGNRDYNSHTCPEYDMIVRYLNEAAGEWEDANFYYVRENGSYTKQRKRPECSVADILHDYGFTRNDGKPWSNKQKHQWKLLFEDGNMDEDEAIVMALQLITGHEWDTTTIRGSCQGEWQDIYYDKALWSRDALEQFEAEYFNTGSEWIIHDSDSKPHIPEEIDGFSIYCYSWNTDGIKKEIAACMGGRPEDVTLWEFDGYSRNPIYKEVV